VPKVTFISGTRCAGRFSCSAETAPVDLGITAACGIELPQFLIDHPRSVVAGLVAGLHQAHAFATDEG
jgi:hypothetical protein